MGQRRKPGVPDETAVEREMRDQEVLRANGELAAYFKGRRTEREARAALKIIKAFVRDRGNRDAKSRPPLPGLEMARTPKEIRKAPRDARERQPRAPRRTRRETSSKSASPTIKRQANTEPSKLPETDERPPD